jgi:hypothetical protein
MKASRKKMPRSYSDFTLTDLREMFGISNENKSLNLPKNKIEPSDWLITTINKHKGIPKGTEKAKSELFIVPVLLEMYDNNPDVFKYFSGYSFDVDPEKALKGKCDFILSRSKSLDIQAPIFSIFEAKDDSLEHWYGQCGAEMYAARLFNEQSNNDIKIIFGAVSNGNTWQFLKLEENNLLIDTTTYGLENLPVLLGTLQIIIDFYTQV